jgi:hypothetical protein
MTHVERDVAAPKEETMRFLFDLMVRGVERQSSTGDVIDAKALNLLAVGTAAVGALAISDVSHSQAATVLLMIAAATWVVVVGIVLWVTHPRKWRVAIAADTLWGRSPQPLEPALHDISETLAENYTVNRKFLTSKASGVKWAVWLVAAEASIVIAALIVSAWSS